MLNKYSLTEEPADSVFQEGLSSAKKGESSVRPKSEKALPSDDLPRPKLVLSAQKSRQRSFPLKSLFSKQSCGKPESSLSESQPVDLSSLAEVSDCLPDHSRSEVELRLKFLVDCRLPLICEGLQPREVSNLLVILGGIVISGRPPKERCQLSRKEKKVLAEVVGKGLGRTPFQGKSSRKAIREVRLAFQMANPICQTRKLEFVFMFASERIFKRFVKKQKIKRNKKTKFLQHYFGKVASTLNLPLQYFDNPFKQSRLEERQRKYSDKQTRGVERFLKNVLTSPLFKEDFAEYLQSGFLEDYLVRVPEKLFRILCDCFFLLGKEEQDHIDWNLPWKHSEVISAIEEVKRMYF